MCSNIWRCYIFIICQIWSPSWRLFQKKYSKSLFLFHNMFHVHWFSRWKYNDSVFLDSPRDFLYLLSSTIYPSIYPPWFYHGDSSTKTQSCTKHGTLVHACVVIMSMTWRNTGTPAKTWSRASVGPALCHILANVWYTISHPYFTICLAYQLQDIRCLVPTVPLLSSFSHILSVRPPVYSSAKPKGSICVLVKLADTTFLALHGSIPKQTWYIPDITGYWLPKQCTWLPTMCDVSSYQFNVSQAFFYPVLWRKEIHVIWQRWIYGIVGISCRLRSFFNNACT